MSIHRPIPVRSEGTFERVLRATGLLFTPRTSPGTHNRGFSLLEVTAGVAAFGILASTVMPPTAEAIRHAGVNRGTAVVAMDLRLASSLASRQRRPVRVTYRSDLDTYTFTDASTGTLLHTRDLSEFKLPSVTFFPSTINIAPSGIASSALTVTLAADSYDRRIQMMRAGMVRVVAR